MGIVKVRKNSPHTMARYLMISLLVAAASAFTPGALNQAHLRRTGKCSLSMGKNAKDGLFTPMVLAAKNVMGDKDLNQLRGKVIGMHSDVIAKFVDTSDSPFGKVALKRLFEIADEDGSGELTREELGVALKKLGFTLT